MGSCWTFGLTSAVESAILKAYGVSIDLSEGNLQHNILRYFGYGCISIDEGSFGTIGASYMVGWYGPTLEETDTYDEVGKLSPYLSTGLDVIHIQDVMYVFNLTTLQESNQQFFNMGHCQQVISQLMAIKITI